MKRALALLALVLVAAACGSGGSARTGRTVTFETGGNFPTLTIVGTYSVAGCTHDARVIVENAHLYYAHSTGLPGPADLYFYDMREAFAHFQADDCTSKQLGDAVRTGLSSTQRTWLLDNVSRNLYVAFRAALNAG
ncbi:MAG TPA: hypothetical protein VKR79_10655 [Gaiellaceae bacterium]|nr:hypothetical protein [Gaiellaceae bacterium]